MDKLKRRKWHYVQSPWRYEIAPCDCGNADTQWSEFKKHLWCQICKKDFIPKHNGIFDGPIPVNLARMIGISFDRVYIKSGKVKRFEIPG